MRTLNKMNNEEIIEKLEDAIKTKDFQLIGDSIRESGIVDMLSYIVVKECHTPLFRVRPQSTREDYSCINIENFSYSPSPVGGRCNLKDNVLLYTSLESKTAVQEMIRKDHVGNNIWLSLWLPKKPIRCLVFLFDSSEIQDDYTKSMHQDIVDNLKKTDANFEENLPLYQWISSQFLSEDYIFSSQFCFELFKVHDIDGILYPSYAGKSYGLNLVLTKEFADHQMLFQDILSLKIDEWNFPSEVKYLILGKSNIYENGNIEWFPFKYNDTAPFITERRLRENSETKVKIKFQHDFSIKLEE